MIKVSSLKKYGIKLDAKDKLSQAFGQKVVTEFAGRNMLMIDDLSLVDICVTVGNDIGHDNTEIEQIHVCDVIPRLWTYWKPSMQWLVQQELVGYKDETDYFGEAVPVEIPTETPEEKEALDAIEKKSPYDVGAHVSGQSRCKHVDIKPTTIKSIQINSEYTIKETEKDSRLNDFYGLKVRVTSIHRDNGDVLITFRHPFRGVGVGIYKEGISEWIKPIKTERENRISAASKNMSDYYFNETGIKFDSVQFNGYAESLDDAGLLK